MLCNAEVWSVTVTGGELLPGYASSRILVPIRLVVQGDTALLHHGCGHPNNRHLVADPDTQWFACLRPDSDIDEETLFDAQCGMCEQRWVAEGHRLWNPEGVSEERLRLYERFLVHYDFKKPAYGYWQLYRRSDREVAEALFKAAERERVHGYVSDRTIEAYELAAGFGDDDLAALARSRIAEIRASA